MSAPDDVVACQLGAVPAEAVLPTSVAIEGKRFFLTKRDGTFALFSSRCPHRGGPLFRTGRRLECPLHGWTFDARSGECTDGRGERLDAVEVVERSGELVARPDPEILDRAHPVRQSIDGWNRSPRFDSNAESDGELAVTKQTVVGEILEARGARARRIFADYGMRCLGCALAATESLRDAADTHCLSAEEFDELLQRLRSLGGS